MSKTIAPYEVRNTITTTTRDLVKQTRLFFLSYFLNLIEYSRKELDVIYMIYVTTNYDCVRKVTYNVAVL